MHGHLHWKHPSPSPPRQSDPDVRDGVPPASVTSQAADSAAPATASTQEVPSRAPGRSAIGSILLQLMLVVGLLGAVGCEHCEERFCKGVRLSTVHMMALAAECCADPAGPGCDELDTRFLEFAATMHEAYEACLDGNVELLRDLIRALLRILPRVVVMELCAEDVDLGDWAEEACHPYVNSSTLFLEEDLITAAIKFESEPRFTSSAESNTMGGLAASTQSPFPASRGYRVSSGSQIQVDAWWGEHRFEVSGRLALQPSSAMTPGVRSFSVSEFDLEFIEEGGEARGSAVLAGGSVPGLVRCLEDGWGMLGVPVAIELAPDAGSMPWLTEHARTVWLELPIRLDRRGGSLGQGAALAAHAVFPVDQVFTSRLVAFDDWSMPDQGGFPGDDTGFMPCELVDGLTVREWGWLQRMRQCFPDCFATE